MFHTTTSFVFLLIVLVACPIAISFGHGYGGWRGVCWAGLAYVLLTWFGCVVAVNVHLAEMEHRAAIEDSPPREVIEYWQGDGSKKMATMAFGWVYGSLYFVLCLVPYTLFRTVESFVTRARVNKQVPSKLR